MFKLLNGEVPAPKSARPPHNARGGAVAILKVKGDNSKSVICMGLDAVYKEITDVGGGVKSTERFFDAAQREFREETLKVFKKYPTSKSVYYHDNMIIIFYVYIFNTEEEMMKYIKDVSDEFERNKAGLKKVEVEKLA